LGREIDREKIKVVIDVLKQKRATWSEIVTQTGIAERSVTRILNEYLGYWGLASKDTEGYWAWYDTVRTIASQADLDLAIDHSKWLVKGIDLYMSLLLTPEQNSEQPKRVLTEEASTFLSCIGAHMKSGYPRVNADIENLQLTLNDGRDFMEAKYPPCQVKDRAWELIESIDMYRQMKKAVPKYSLKIVKIVEPLLTSEDFAKLSKFQEEKTQLFNKINKAIQVLKIRAESNQPLEGKCHLCPNVRQSTTP
jgi:hypothetical protein